MVQRKLYAGRPAVDRQNAIKMLVSHHAFLSSFRLMDDLSSFSEVDGLHHSFNPFLIEAFLDHFEDVKLRLFGPL
jgi:hypothetical protein